MVPRRKMEELFRFQLAVGQLVGRICVPYPQNGALANHQDSHPFQRPGALQQNHARPSCWPVRSKSDGDFLIRIFSDGQRTDACRDNARARAVRVVAEMLTLPLPGLVPLPSTSCGCAKELGSWTFAAFKPQAQASTLTSHMCETAAGVRISSADHQELAGLTRDLMHARICRNSERRLLRRRATSCLFLPICHQRFLPSLPT